MQSFLLCCQCVLASLTKPHHLGWPIQGGQKVEVLKWTPSLEASARRLAAIGGPQPQQMPWWEKLNDHSFQETDVRSRMTWHFYVQVRSKIWWISNLAALEKLNLGKVTHILATTFFAQFCFVSSLVNLPMFFFFSANVVDVTVLRQINASFFHEVGDPEQTWHWMGRSSMNILHEPCFNHR